MKIEVQRSFQKDILKIRDKKLAANLTSIIEKLEKSSSLSDIKSLKKMKAMGNYFRIRIGNYRLGFKEDENVVTLLRFMHRKEIYNYFP